MTRDEELQLIDLILSETGYPVKEVNEWNVKYYSDDGDSSVAFMNDEDSLTIIQVVKRLIEFESIAGEDMGKYKLQVELQRLLGINTKEVVL